MATKAPTSTDVREDYGASGCLDDSPALFAWDQRYTLRQSSLQQLQEIAKCARLPELPVQTPFQTDPVCPTSNTILTLLAFCREMGLRGRSRMRKPELLQALEELHAHERIMSMHKSLQAPPGRRRPGKAGAAH